MHACIHNQAFIYVDLMVRTILSGGPIVPMPRPDGAAADVAGGSGGAGGAGAGGGAGGGGQSTEDVMRSAEKAYIIQVIIYIIQVIMSYHVLAYLYEFIKSCRQASQRE
jgi:hypothetical protein